MKAAVVRFPGSNCDFDMYYALQDFGVDVALVDEKATSLAGFDAVFLQVDFHLATISVLGRLRALHL